MKPLWEEALKSERSVASENRCIGLRVTKGSWFLLAAIVSDFFYQPEFSVQTNFFCVVRRSALLRVSAAPNV